MRRKCETRRMRENNNTKHDVLLLGALLEELRRATTFWFRTRSTDDTTNICPQILAACVEILRSGFKLDGNESFDKSQSEDVIEALLVNSDNQSDTLTRLVDDFEFLRITEVMLHASSGAVGGVAAATIGKVSTTHMLPQPQSATDFLRIWITQCFATRSLAQCLQCLVADKELIEYYYTDDAFLRHNNYATALFICLSAIELNQCSLLSNLDVQLLRSPNMRHKSQYNRLSLHRRTISQPNFSIPMTQALNTVKEEETMIHLAPSVQSHTASVVVVRRVKSLPNIDLNAAIDTNKATSCTPRRRRRCKTLCSPSIKSQSTLTTSLVQPPSKLIKKSSHRIAFDIASSSVSPASSYNIDELDMLPSTSAGSRRSQASSVSTTSSSNASTSYNSATSNSVISQRIQLINCDNIKIWTDQSNEQQQSQTTSLEIKKQKKTLSTTKSPSPINNFFTNLFGSTPIYTRWSRNYAGESLCSDDAISSESNAVFDTFLPINGKKLSKPISNNLFQDGISMLDYTPPTSNNNSRYNETTAPVDIVGHGCNSSTASSQKEEESLSSSSKVVSSNQSLAAFLQMTRFSRNNTDLEKENAHFRISEACISAIEHVKWARQKQQQQQQQQQSSSSPSAVVDSAKATTTVDMQQIELNAENIPYAEISDNSNEIRSAESVGLTLISKFNDKQLPKVSDLKWLVSEDDTPQKMIPLPTSYTTKKTPEDNDAMIPPMTRGTKYWAPPRQQIIFTDHPLLSRIELLHKQNYRCAGCGMRVNKQHMQHFRYCTYLGKYMCTGCHRNQISAIPAKILQNWDFKCYPVSVFAYRLIEQMYTFPLFYVPDLNPALYIKFRLLAVSRHKRTQLKFVKDFIMRCRFATKEQSYFVDVPEHITADPDIWSMCDFVDVQNRSMRRSIVELITLCEKHVLNCVLCTGRGFVCEFCRNVQVIYPWQSKTLRCGSCGACFHQSCWTSMALCCRCSRIQKRQSDPS